MRKTKKYFKNRDTISYFKKNQYICSNSKQIASAINIINTIKPIVL